MVGLQPLQLVLQYVALPIPSYDAVDFPEEHVMQKFLSVPSDFAHDQLEQAVSGDQFFSFVSCFSDSAFSMSGT